MPALASARAGTLALGLVGLLASLLLAELVVRFLSPVTLGFQYRDGRFAPPLEFSPDFARNRLGYHDVDHGPKAPSVKRLLLIGDSFVEGAAVRVPQTVGRRLDHHLNEASPGGWEVVAVGGPGWNPAGELRLLRELAPKLEPDLVVTVFFPGNDVGGVSKEVVAELERERREVKRGLRPRPHGFSAEDARYFWIRSSVLNQLVSYRLTRRARDRSRTGVPVEFLVFESPVGPLYRDAWREIERVLTATRDAVRSLPASYAVVSASTPWGVLGDDGLEQLLESYPDMRGRRWDLDQPDALLAEICERNGISLLLLQPSFREETLERGRHLHFPYDGHWNAAGHDFAGQRIADFVLGHSARPGGS